MSPVLPKFMPFGSGTPRSAPFRAPTRPPAFNPTNGLPRGARVDRDRTQSRVHYGRDTRRRSGPRGR